MADQNSLRSYQPHVPHSRAGSVIDDGRGGAGDPLAELARLIGQTDPFADLERKRMLAEAERAAAISPEGQAYSQGYTDQHGHADPYPYGHAADAAGAYSHEADHQAYQQYAQGQGPHPDQAYDPAAADYSAEYDAYYGPDGQPLDEMMLYQQEEAQRRRRRRLVTVVAVFGLAVVGSAGAFGYRTYVHRFAKSGPPPIIRADSAPTKVIPAAKAADAASNKAIYDRVGDRGTGERVISREERPVEIKTVAVRAASPGGYSSGATSMAAAAPHATATIPVAPPSGNPVFPTSAPSLAMESRSTDDPPVKRVHTVAIRPDMTIVREPGSVAPPEAVRPAPVAVPARVPLPSAQTRSAPIAPAPRQPERSVERPRSSAPLSLAPTDAAEGSAPASVSLAPPRPSQPPAPSNSRAGAPLNLTASAAPEPAIASRASAPPQPTAHGAYAVQVSSQRSEADARSSFHTLQGKYPNVLGGRNPLIRRADLGKRGVYYRTMIGPFASAEEAAALCSSLKAAGGQCLIQRN